MIDDLQRVSALHKKGAMADAEYEKAKAEEPG
jgi:hypothetical protein